MSDLTGTHGVIVGVANKRSIAWAIAKALPQRRRAAGADLSGRAARGERARAGGGARPIRSCCRATSRATSRSTRCSRRSDKEFGGLDFLVHGAAFAPREDLRAPFVQTSREGFRLALDVSAYSLIALRARRAPLMEKRGGGSILTLTLSRQPARVHELQRDGRGEGRARSVGALSRERARAAEHPRQRDLGGPDQDARRGGHRRLLEHPAGVSRPAPLRRTVETSEVADAASFLLGPAGRRSPARS